MNIDRHDPDCECCECEWDRKEDAKMHRADRRRDERLEREQEEARR